MKFLENFWFTEEETGALDYDDTGVSHAMTVTEGEPSESDMHLHGTIAERCTQNGDVLLHPSMPGSVSNTT